MKLKRKSIWKNYSTKKGFTLIELILVMTIIVIVTGISLGSLTSSQSLQVFNNNLDTIVGIISNARSMAITGKGQLDYTDADNDKCNNVGAVPPAGSCTAPDYVTPANYGVYFNTAAGSPNVSLFADVTPPSSGAGTGSKGKYDNGGVYANGDDLLLGQSLTLPSTFSLQLLDGTTPIASTDGSIFFSPNYADISFEKLTASPILNIKLSDTNFSRCRMISIHKLAGVPEVKACP